MIATFEVAGETLRLLPERALHRPAADTLYVADAHFGKDAHFRASGLAIPAGTTGRDLERLDRALATTRARRLVVLGDFLHDVGSRADETFDALRAWRARNERLAIVLVAGNHDERAGPPPDDLGVEIAREPHADGPFALLHHPRAVDGAYAIAGHVHPGLRLAPARGRAIGVPVFLARERCLVLPSFGGFTGLGLVEPEPSDRVWLCGERAVVEWTPPGR